MVRPNPDRKHYAPDPSKNWLIGSRVRPRRCEHLAINVALRLLRWIAIIAVMFSPFVAGAVLVYVPDDYEKSRQIAGAFLVAEGIGVILFALVCLLIIGEYVVWAARTKPETPQDWSCED